MKPLKYGLAALAIVGFGLYHAYFVAPQEANRSKINMVATAQHLATKTGLHVLGDEGNAIDAAVAIAYTLAVTHPCCGNIGGGGFMLIHLANGENHFINFREKAPAATRLDLYKGHHGKMDPKKIQRGYLAVGVPGTVKGLEYARKTYGTAARRELLQDAIQYAEKGYKLTKSDARILNRLQRYRDDAAIDQLLSANHYPFAAGETFRQPALAKSLKLILEQGENAFYVGPIAQSIVRDSKKRGGVLTLADFKNYTIQDIKPLTCDYKGYKILTAPPPSSGGVALCEMLKITAPYSLAHFGFHSPMAVHYQTEAMRFAFADRNHHLGDPDFVDNPIEQLLSAEHIKTIQETIQQNKATPSISLQSRYSDSSEKQNTTHFSVVDAKGNAVSVTYTINGYFGAKIQGGDTGIFLNSEMDDFSLGKAVPNQFHLTQGDANLIAPNKRPLSSMTPTIVLKDDTVKMVLGAPGGPTIITSVFQVIQNALVFDMSLTEAVQAPRFHMQWMPDTIFMETDAFTESTIKALKAMGYGFTLGFNGRKQWGNVMAVERSKDNQYWIGAADPRHGNGLAMGE